MKNLLDIYKEEQLLTVENRKVIILPTDQYSFTSYPIPEDRVGCISISKDEYFGLLLNKFMFNETLSGITSYVAPKLEIIEDVEEDTEEDTTETVAD